MAFIVNNKNFSYNVSFEMDKFRHFKGRLINSKRDSQKISEEELCCAREKSLSRIKLYLSTKLQDDIHRIKEENYKLATSTMGHADKRGINNNLQKKERQQKGEPPKQARGYPGWLKQKKRKKQQLQIKEQIQLKNISMQDYAATIKKTASTSNISQERESFGRILELMRRINQLKQRKNFTGDEESEQLSKEIKIRQKEVKELIATIEDYSQRNLLDFYSEDVGSPSSSDSFNSQNSGKTYQINSEREALELSDQPSQQNTSQFQIKYRRISMKSTNEDDTEQGHEEMSINDTFLEEIDEEEGLQESPISANNDRNIVHLFSYDQDKYLDSPLSKISQRDSEYYSPDSKNCNSNSLFSGESLEYKKIFYLLETTEKKHSISSLHKQSREKEISQFTGDGCSNRQGNISLQSISRSHCRQQLSEMITLLQKKYNRKVRTGPQNVMDLLNEPCRVNVLSQVKRSEG